VASPDGGSSTAATVMAEFLVPRRSVRREASQRPERGNAGSIVGKN
jgi:hypothetical protein